MSQYKRDSFCGPAGDGWLSKLLSAAITKILDWLKLYLDEECEDHDVDWDKGPSFLADLKFSMRVYKKVRKKNALLALVVWFLALVFVRATALVYRLLRE